MVAANACVNTCVFNVFFRHANTKTIQFICFCCAPGPFSHIAHNSPMPCTVIVAARTALRPPLLSHSFDVSWQRSQTLCRLGKFCRLTTAQTFASCSFTDGWRCRLSLRQGPARPQPSIATADLQMGRECGAKILWRGARTNQRVLLRQAHGRLSGTHRSHPTD